MTPKLMVLPLAFALVATVTFASPAGEEDAAAAATEKEMVRDPSTGKMVTAPEYGGTITFARTSTGEHTDGWYIGGFAYHYTTLVNEKLGIGDWGLDRDVFDWRTSAQPLSAFKGHLADSWETPDPTTFIFHIRQGVHWHDKAPMNGRELTAKDIQFNYHRLLGIGSGFSEASPHARYALPATESVTATDQGTVVFKLKETNLTGLARIIDGWISAIYPPEVIKQHGDMRDWTVVVGTGPYELTDVTEGSSMTWTKNPDYWSFDEKYPENRLPYADQIKTLILPDPAARLAALRSGRIDMLERSVILRHAVKNAIIPVVTLVGMQLPILVGGSVIIENIFNLPGLGRLMLDALNERDYPVVSAVNLFFATVVVFVNLLTDLLYASLDPRIRYE